MSYVWFNLVLAALGKRLNYDAVINLYGNSFAKDANKIVQASNPLVKNGGKKTNKGVMDLMSNIKIVKQQNNKPLTDEVAQATLTSQLGDISWATDLFKGFDKK